MKEKLSYTGKKRIGLPCYQMESNDKDGKPTIFVWNYLPTTECFHCSFCGKEAVKFIAIGEYAKKIMVEDYNDDE